MPPPAGIFHTSGLLDNAPFAQQHSRRITTFMGPKIRATEHLDRECGALDILVLFSSATGLPGSSGQANHAAANTALDAFATQCRAYRKNKGILHCPSKVVYTFLRRAIEIEIGIAIVIEMK